MAWKKQTLLGEIMYEVDDHGNVWQTITNATGQHKTYHGTLTCPAFVYGLELEERGFREV